MFIRINFDFMCSRIGGSTGIDSEDRRKIAQVDSTLKTYDEDLVISLENFFNLSMKQLFIVIFFIKLFIFVN